jgi:hypothetical protein
MLTRDDAAQAHWQALQQGDLPQFVIYDSPKDHPGKFVVRMWRIGLQMGPTDTMAVFDTLEQARAFIPLGLFCMTRSPEDDPVIVETWF